MGSDIVLVERGIWMIEIGSLLRSLRISKGLTLEEAAETSGINASHLSETERGNKSPRFNTVAQIVESYECVLRVSIEGASLQISMSSYL